MIRVAPCRGSFRGGTPLALFGADLDMSACSDDLTGAGLNAIWTDESAGGGVVAPTPAVPALTFTSSATPGASARLVTVDDATDVDVEVTFQLLRDTRVAGRNVYGSLGLVAATTVTFQVGGDRTGRLAVVHVERGGQVLLHLEQTLAPSTALGEAATLRLLRAGQDVTLFLSGEPLTTFKTSTEAAQVVLEVLNDPTEASEVDAALIAYMRRPVVVFGTAPMLDYVPHGATQATGSTPEVSAALDTIPVTVTASGGVVVAEDAFTFTRERDLIRFDGRQSLTVINDERLTKR